MKLTATTVRTAALPAGKTEAIFFDDDIPGFGLRLREGGSRSFVFQYKLGDKHRRMALGRATALNLTEIRKLALQHYASVRRGEDPAADKADAVRQVSETFESYVVKYLAALRQRLRPRSFKEIRTAPDQARQATASDTAREDRPARRGGLACCNHKRRRHPNRKPSAIVGVRVLHLGDGARTRRKQPCHRNRKERGKIQGARADTGRAPSDLECSRP